MYTKFHVHLRFKETTPAEVIGVMRWLIERPQLEPPNYPEHLQFMEHGRIKWMLHHASYYHCIRPATEFWFDDITKQWILNATCDFRNYDDDIDTFMAFVFPHVDKRGFAGYKIYEEDTHPTLIYLEEGKSAPTYKVVV
jgi:hypothetical protein